MAVEAQRLVEARGGLRDDQVLPASVSDGRAEGAGTSRLKQASARAERVRADASPRRQRRPQGLWLPGDLLDAVFASRRDAGASFDAYLRYRDGGCRSRDLDVAFARALPVIREVCTSRDRVLVGAAAWAIYRALRARRFKTGGAHAYWAYVRQTARGAMAHQRAADDRFRLVDRVPPEVCTDVMGLSGRLVGIREVERKMVVEKIPILVADEVVRRLPFEGEELKASLFFLESLIDGRDVAVRGLSDLFDVPRERLRELLDYVAVAARMALWRLRVELRAAAGNDLGWQGALSMRAWLYGEDDEDGARGG